MTLPIYNARKNEVHPYNKSLMQYILAFIQYMLYITHVLD